jgi:hypothetical protein
LPILVSEGLNLPLKIGATIEAEFVCFHGANNTTSNDWRIARSIRMRHCRLLALKDSGSFDCPARIEAVSAKDARVQQTLGNAQAGGRGFISAFTISCENITRSKRRQPWPLA